VNPKTHFWGIFKQLKIVVKKFPTLKNTHQKKKQIEKWKPAKKKKKQIG